MTPAPVAREAAPTLHSRYQGIWEERPEDWPDDEPWEVDVDKHDFTERRWLIPTHQAALDAGELEVPDRTQMSHSAVLVSVPDEASGTYVAWVDQGVAEVVCHAARLGAPTAESCENAGRANGWEDMPTFWFDDEDGLDKFADLVASQKQRGWSWYYPGSLKYRLGWWAAWLGDRIIPGAVPWPRGDGPFAVAIPADDLPRVTAALRDIPTPSPYGPAAYLREM